jgi:hypothetical protein
VRQHTAGVGRMREREVGKANGWGRVETTMAQRVASVVGMRSAGLVGWLGSDEGERGYKYSC